MKKMYAVVGNWGFQPAPKGITTYEYHPETGELELIETIRPDIAAGQLAIDEKRGIVYAVHECGDRHGEVGGGGYIMAFRIDPETGRLTLVNQKDSLSPEPSYVCLDRSGQYLMVCHCSDPWHVTRIVKREDGSYGNEVLFDDAGLVLFRLNEDGSIGEACDVSILPAGHGKDPDTQVNVDPVTGHVQLVRVISRQHAIVGSPSSEVFALMDKGMDKVYTYKLDRKNGRLLLKDVHSAEKVACFPRYAAFHPALPILYVNNENLAQLDCFSYDEESAKLEPLCSIPLLEEDPGLVAGKPVGAQDILVHPGGRTLYVTLCGLDCIVTVSLDKKGLPSLRGNIDSEGKLPRGICLTPDGRYLLSGNMLSGDITEFEIEKDGSLRFTGRRYPAVSPSAIRFFVC